ncbi:hypothetical protein HRbin37_00050 [bacterium HR37]|nr:hypothetical protein HRbin37_00050 [bacterium HR37]
MQYEVYDLDKNKVGTVELNPKVFGGPVKEHLFYYVVIGNWPIDAVVLLQQRQGVR